MISDTDLLLLAAAAAAYIAVAAAVLALRQRKGKKPRYFREALKLVFFLYAAMLLKLTILPAFGFYGMGYLSVNLVPFRTISGYIGFIYSQEINFNIIRDNLLGNVAVFLPMGLLVPAIWPKLGRFWKTLLFGMLFSVGIELAQLAFSLLGMIYRTTDVDDVLLNTLGAAIGYGLFALVKLIMPSRFFRVPKAPPQQGE
jgi:glycopeptide antibiotics resistance protein